MTPYQRRQMEIETIKPRTFTLELSDTDIQRLYEKAYSNGITPAELITGFIGDLVDGTYTHGSDERGLAREYFERCCYDAGIERNFLQWALYERRFDDIADSLEDLGEVADGPDSVQDAKDAIERAESELKEIYSEYAAETENPQEYSAGIAAISNYINEVQAMTERGAL